MVRNDDFDRRTVLRGAAGVLGAGVLAGCSGGSGSSGNGSGGNGSDGNGSDENGSGGGGSSGDTTTGDGSGGSMDSGTGTESTTGTDAGTSGVSAKVEQWLADAKGYDGSIADKTGTDTVEIAVGAGNAGYAFDPAGVRVSPGTTIRWTWTGRGGAHNVVAKDEAFNSGQIQAGSDIVYEATLDQSGTHRYYCVPHRRLGMKGAVVVGNA